MNSIHKVRLVDEEELSRIIEKRLKDYNPNLHVLGQMEIEMDSILKQTNLTPEEKLTMFQGVQSKFKRLKDRYSQPTFTEAGKTRPQGLMRTGPEENLINFSQPANVRAVHSSAPANATGEAPSQPVGDDLLQLAESPERPESSFDRFSLRERLNKSYEGKYSNLLGLLKTHSNLISVNPNSREILIRGKQIPGSDLFF